VRRTSNNFIKSHFKWQSSEKTFKFIWIKSAVKLANFLFLRLVECDRAIEKISFSRVSSRGSRFGGLVSSFWDEITDRASPLKLRADAVRSFQMKCPSALFNLSFVLLNCRNPQQRHLRSDLSFYRIKSLCNEVRNVFIAFVYLPAGDCTAGYDWTDYKIPHRKMIPRVELAALGLIFNKPLRTSSILAGVSTPLNASTFYFFKYYIMSPLHLNR